MEGPSRSGAAVQQGIRRALFDAARRQSPGGRLCRFAHQGPRWDQRANFSESVTADGFFRISSRCLRSRIDARRRPMRCLASSAALWFPRTGVCGPCLTPTRAHVALGGEGAVVRRGRDRIGRLRPRRRRAAGLLVEDRAGGELEEAGRGSRRREGATGDSKRSDILRGEVEDENGPHSGAGRFLLLTAGRDADQPGWQRDELSMIKQDHVTKQRSRARSVKSRSAALQPTHGLRRSLLN